VREKENNIRKRCIYPYVMENGRRLYANKVFSSFVLYYNVIKEERIIHIKFL